MPRVTAIVFDLDGTLIDSARDLADSVNHALGQHGLPRHPLETIRSYVGDGVIKLIERAIGPGNPDCFDRVLSSFTDHYSRHCTDHTRLYAGVLDTLEFLVQKYSLAVLTNKSQTFSVTILENLGIASCFRAIIGGDTPVGRKPDPGGILTLAAQWNLTPAEFLMVGDHATDIETGRNAGCRTVFYSGGIGETRGLAPDFTIDSLANLPALLEKIS